MREIRVSSTLTVYHDGQFWVGMFERVEEGRLRACRVVFGPEPSAEEIQQLVCERWDKLCFCEPVGCDEAPKVSQNPKRRQREAARELGRRGPSTKAQQALSEAREVAAQERKSDARMHREREQQERFEKRQEKRKQKKRGR
jgi:hypothetical protein